MGRTVCIIQGHPHGGAQHLCHAIADAYTEGARLAGADVRTVDIGRMDLTLLRDPADFPTAPSSEIVTSQEAMRASDHIVIIHPLWLGAMPAATRAFFEHLCRNNFAIAADDKGGWPRQMLKGKSARVIVTMGMPALAYRLAFGAFGIRAFERSILGISGIRPVRESLIGGVSTLSPTKADALLAKIKRLGRRLG